jgi:uncharacterized protein YbcI
MTDSTGELAAALANAIVALTADYTGRGSSKSRCYVHTDLVVCVLHDSLTSELVEIVERLTGRKVAAFMSSNHVNPDVAIESFVLELLDAPRDQHDTLAQTLLA